MNKQSKIYVAGHTGFVGGAVLKQLQQQGYENIITAPRSLLDLTNQQQTMDFFKKEQPEYVFMCAAKVGGILPNIQYMAEFLMENAQITCHTLYAAHTYGVKKLLYMGSSCMYPKDCPQPIKEEYILTKAPEPTNEGHAIAKIMGAKQCEYYNKQYEKQFFCCVSCNAYGPGDHYDPENGHVAAALIRRFHDAKIANAPFIEVWGTGTVRREFIYIDDLAAGLIQMMERCENEYLINIGFGSDISIYELAYLIKQTTGYIGEIRFDPSKPDGIKQKLMDCSKIKQYGWSPNVSLEKGLKQSYKWFLNQININ